MKCKESDWKLFRKLLPHWQERYMNKLNKEYIDILNQNEEASTIFWQLYARIKKDRTSPGVILEIRRSLLTENIVSLINDNIITFEDLNEFSDEMKEDIKNIIER